MSTRSMTIFFCLFFLMAIKADAQQIALTDTGNHIAATDTAFVRVPLRYQHCNRRSPVLALGLDMLFPAVGQIYNKQYLKAGVIYSVALASGIGLLANNFQPEPYDNNNKPLILQYKPANKTTNTILEGILLADLFYSLVDAPISAMRINKKYHIGKKTRSFAALQVSPDIINTGDRRVAGFSVILR